MNIELIRSARRITENAMIMGCFFTGKMIPGICRISHPL